MPDSESRVERVLNKVVEAQNEQTHALLAQAEVMRDLAAAMHGLAESNHRLADAYEREHAEGREDTDPAHADLSKRDDGQRYWPLGVSGLCPHPQGDDEPSTL